MKPNSITATMLLILAVCTATSAAENALRPGRAELYPTWHAIGIEIPYTGDANANAKASFLWRLAGETTWRNGVEMVRDEARRLWWASIFPLSPNQRIEVQVAFEDPDGCDAKLLEAKTATRPAPAQSADGHQIWVSPAGKDDASGTKDAPYRTISRAARDLNGGDTIHVLSGTYPECVELNNKANGTWDHPTVFVGEGPTQPIIDASAAIERGATWTDVGGGVFSHPAEGKVTLVIQDGTRAYGYSSMKDLQADAMESRRAFFHDSASGRLCVKTGTDKPPSAYMYQLATRPNGFDLQGASHVVIRNFEIRNTSDAAVRIGVAGDAGVSGNAILGNSIRNCRLAISINDPKCDDTAIWGNTIRLTGQTDFTWNATMAEYWEFSCIGLQLWTGRGTSVIGNRLEGYRYLITLEPPTGEAAKLAASSITGNRDLDIMYNELFNAADDGLEADSGGVNVRVYANHMRNCNTGISIAPCTRGPVYVLRNDFTFRTLMFKFGINQGTSYGACFCDHNSGYALTRDSSEGIYFNAKLPTAGKRFRNNIIVMTGEDMISAMRPQNLLDGNCYWRVGDKPAKFQWESKWLHGLAAFQEASGMEKSGLAADPMLGATPGIAAYAPKDYTSGRASEAGLVTSAGVSDFRLRTGSPCIDHGVPIRGINDDFAGAAPDIGAYEVGRESPPSGPAALQRGAN